MLPDNGIVNVRLVCDEYGRCYRTRGGQRVVIQQEYGDSYNYAPRERYLERRGYYDGGYYDNGGESYSCRWFGLIASTADNALGLWFPACVLS
jgi:hypothetical protein